MTMTNCLRRQSMMLMRGLNRVTASGNDLHAGSGLGALLSLGEEGGALVESAIVLPIMLLISTGLLIFGIAVNNYLCLTEATSTGARLLAVSRGQTLDPCATTVTAIENAAPTLTPGNFTFTFVLNGTNYPGSTCSSKNTSSGAAANLVQGKSATVTVAYPCALGIFGETFSAKGCTLTSQTTELVQ